MRHWGRALAALASVALGTLAACSGGDTTAPNCDAIAAALVSRIEVKPPSATVNLGDSLQLQAVAYSCAGVLGDVKTFTWRSADEATVTVDPTGLVKPVAPGGPVAIIATAQGKDGSASITTRPVPVERVVVEPATATVGVGRTSTLTVRAFDAQDREITGRPVTWSSANPNVVSVNQSGAVTGVAAGGPVAVTATIEGKSGASQVSVTTIPVSTVTVAPATATIAAGTTQQFTAVLRDELGNTLTGRAVNWTSSDPTIASIGGATGLATGNKPGTVTITATSEGKTGTAQLTVNIGAAARLRFVQQPAASVEVGASLGTITVEITDAAGNRVTTFNQSVTIGLTAPANNAFLTGTKTVTASNGLATFGDLTVTTAGTYSLTATAAGLTSAQSNIFVVTVPPVAITTASLPGATVGTAYNQTLAATGGTGTYTWSIVAGALPAGLTLNAGTGAISGTPTTAGTATFTVRASSGGQTADRQLSIVVAAQPTNALTVTMTGANSSATVTSSPAGISCTLTNGTQGGTCTFGYVSGNVTLTAAPAAGTTFLGWSGSGCSGTGTCVVNMNSARAVTATFQPTLTITTASPMPGATVGTAYNQTLAATGGTGSYTWSVTAGALPAGLTLNTNTGVISGTPTTTGTANFTVRATSGTQTATKALSIVVGAAPTSTVTVATSGTGTGGVTSSPAGISCGSAGADCSQAFDDGTTVTLTASPSAGSTFGGWTGCPSASGTTCTITSISTDANITATFTLSTFTLTVSRGGSGSGTVTSNTGGINCGTSCSASYTSGTTVTLTATPASGSTFTGWSGGGCTGTGTCVVTVTSATSVSATFQRLRTVTVSEAGSGSGTVTSSPTGISCPATCSAAFVEGTTVTLTEAAATGSTFTGWTGCSSTSGATCTLSSLAADVSVTAAFAVNPTITTTTLPAGVVGTPYTQALAASGGVTPYTWTLASGTLPAGLSLVAGSITGTPTAAGQSSFTVRATSADGGIATQALVLDIAAGATAGATQLGFLVQPTNVNANTAISPAVQVEVRDATGGRVSSSTASVILVFGVNAGGGTLSGNTATAQSGLATFSNLRVSAPGTGYTLVATSAGLEPDTSTTFRVR